MHFEANCFNDMETHNFLHDKVGLVCEFLKISSAENETTSLKAIHDSKLTLYVALFAKKICL
jgi:hypothetical protein